ncbi:galactosylceramide sulfotransferase [Lingula anatina]|uniref:Galactosylceramide sulfotransferase n=1 Tax=Lingula anatina TaxID=7574 RepID=A0A1S3JE04_LINAN|nr:galactosylceramide sulfotransferase [Lingula anatina]XP_013408562.1 galactosylceramide sulfotransferase [Lingula anatina]XP_013408563.1 galactosylceramide sulfotransferase [Lingula anatina]XP_013408564.1 galactosylceramide sulfotransferase [Lingula anatina]|eukprot:XP_013408561.1 galactosylceramide sulfotransferase [Lingula anatina]
MGRFKLIGVIVVILVTCCSYLLVMTDQASSILSGEVFRPLTASSKTKISDTRSLADDYKMSLVYRSSSDIAPVPEYKSFQGATWPGRCSPHRHIVFVKIPKTGSTTVSNILLRYAFQNDLRVALPAAGRHNLTIRNSNYDLHADQFDSTSRAKYDIMAHHSNYSREAVARIMPADSVYVVMLREPLTHFVSGFNFFKVGEKLGLEGRGQLHTFLSSRDLYKSRKVPNLINVMIKYLGFPTSPNKNITSVNDFLRIIDKEFDYVLILKYIDEGLVMLKRRLCWDIADIIYLKIHKIKATEYQDLKREGEDPAVSQLLHKLSKKDYLLYQYFKRKFEKTLLKQNDDFFEEVKFLKETNEKVSTFCKARSKDSTLNIRACNWTRGFTIRKPHCKLMKLTNVKFSVLLKNKFSKSVRNDVTRRIL